MKTFFSTRTLSLGLLLSCALFLAGCSAAISFPDVVVDEQTQGPSVQGSVYGGHAPIVGAHVYLLQPGTSGIGSIATSILGNNGATSAAGYTISTNSADPYLPSGAKYVTTDSTGAFNLSGAYTCAAGEPVYIYSYGGTPSVGSVASPVTYSVSQFETGTVTTSGVLNVTYTVTLTFTVSPAELLYSGENITISGLSGNYSFINGSQVVLNDKNLQTSTFDITVSETIDFLSGKSFPLASNTTYTTANFGTSGTVTPAPQSNSSIVLLATLGNCPTTGNLNFGGGSTDQINYIYLNEISTVATAYTFQPFTLSTNNDAVHIGSSGTTQGLMGIENAANTAGQLYSIQGSVDSSVPDGEGHIANSQTQLNGVANQGNGVVPQATIDTLGNILAACVDSAPNGSNKSGTLSVQCSTLFTNATDNGLSNGTKPTDTATAAINIARYPAGNYSSTNANPPTNFVTNLYGIPTGDVPFTPNLKSAPPNFMIAINYPQTAVATAYSTATNPLLGRAESIAVDQMGQIWITAQTNEDVVLWSPLGAQIFTHSDGYIYGYVSVDGSNNAWTGNAASTSSIEEFGANGTLTGTYGSGYNEAYTVVANQSGDAFFFANTTATGNNYQMFEYGPGGSTITGSPFSISPSVITAGDDVAHGSVDSSGDLWLTTETSDQIARVTATGAKVFTPIVTPQQPEFPAIDSQGNAWIAIQADPSVIYKVAPSGTYTVLSQNGGTVRVSNGQTSQTVHNTTATGATLTGTFGCAIDGNGNVWLANRAGLYGSTSGDTGTNTIIELNGSNNLAISPTTNYILEAQYPATSNSYTNMLDDPLNVAIDSSGNVWVTNYLGNSVVQIVGAAAPVVTPLSVAAGTNKLGQTP